MRTPAFFFFCCALAFGVCSLKAVDAPNAASAGKPADKAATAKPEVKKTEPPAKIPGYVINRPSGKFLSLDVVNNVFVLKFYDAKKKPERGDASRAMAKWHPKQKLNNMTAMLLPSGDGKSLVGNKVVQPPLIFKVYLTLYNASDAVLETYVVDYRDGPDDGEPVN